MTCPSKLLWSPLIVLCREEVDAVPGLIPGLYLLLAFTPARPELTPFYAGQSADLRRRLRQHLSSHDPVIGRLPKVLSTYAVMARVDDVASRLAAERTLIARFRPAGNERIPSAPPSIAVGNPPLSLLPNERN